MHPPPSLARTDFTLITECTPESSGCISVYSVAMTIDLFRGLKTILSIGNLVDSPTRRVGESFFYYEYLREFEIKIGTARNIV